MSVAAVILAAGGGARFRTSQPPGASTRSKLLAHRDGRPLLTYAIAPALAAGLDEVVVVSGATDLSGVMPAGVSIVQNDRWADGQATSLAAGLAWCADRGHEAAVVGLGDIPGLTAAAWRAIASAPGGPIVFATYGGRRGHPVRLDAEVWPLLPTEGDEGARVVAKAHPEYVTEQPCEGDLTDIDTVEDLAQWS